MMSESSSSNSKIATIMVNHQPSSSNISLNNGAAIAVGKSASRYPSSATFTVSSTDTSASDRLSTDAPLPEENLTIFMRFMDYFFRNLGYFLADHAKLVLTLVLIFTVITSLKIPFTKQEDDLKTGYTPAGARSHQEVAMYEDFYAKQGSEPIGVVVFVTARDNGSLARTEYLNATVNLIDDIARNFFIRDMNFYQFCSDFCEFNEPVRHFRNGFVIQDNENSALINSDELFDSRINLSFPFMSVLGRELDLSPVFFGVKKFDNAEAQRKAHAMTNIERLPLIVLQYRADKPVNVTKEDVVNWERAVEHFHHHEYKNEYIQPRIMSVTFAGDEIVRNGMTLFPFISVGFLIMSTFSIFTVWLSAYYFDQWTVHKISLAINACICPLLATSSSLGLLFWFGFRFGTILAVTPFLVMAIGVDDAFLMIHSWQRICVERRELNNKVSGDLYTDNLRDRIAAMIVDCGPSISITSATNVLAFVVGIFSPTPEITLFCAANAVAIFFDYIYQFLLFTPIMIIAANFEMKSEDRRYKKPQQADEERRQKITKVLRQVMKRYSRWIADEFTFVLTFLILIVYWIVSIRGALRINASITPEKLFLGDSLVTQMNILRDTYILPNYTALSVFVNNVGDMSQKTQQDRMKSLIAEFESMPECLGPDYSHFWMRDYEKFMQTMEDEEVQQEGGLSDRFTEQEMSLFLNWPEYKHWKGFIRFNDNGTMSKFYAVVAFHGEKMVSWNFRGQMLNRWRAIADRYSDLEAWVFEDDARFLDQIETMVPATISSSIATLICMALICTIFMGNLFTTAVATFSILSVCIGVFGFLAMWGVDLDPISMATTIMSIGFSVDFPAHASFHYYRCGVESGNKMSPEERVLHVITAIGYPLLQCGLSTVFFVFCLLFVPSYMSEVFVKTMVLVISFGLIHGLYVIPVTLCALSRIYDMMFTAQKPMKSTIKKLQKSMSLKKVLNVQNDETNQKNVAKVTVQDS
ncbi:hypothetical protein FO519_000694 [Halicephalobus sp. NKZ332]|nr:hypothetical protein FO519_000694 [Halicephalobus sp. NKZ332]